MSTLLQDLRYACRQLRNSPGFALAAALTLALGIGANTAVFSVVDAVLLRPLPYSQPDRLVSVQAHNPKRPASRAPLSYPNFFDFRKQNHVFDHLVTYHDNQFTLTAAGQPLHLDGEMVTWDLFPMLGVQPALGRSFLPNEEKAGTYVTVLSYEFWETHFGGDRSIVGRSITLDQHPYTVIGVAPAGFEFPPDNPAIQLWTTIAPDAEAPPGYQPITEQRGAFLLPVIARLKSGVTIDQARAQLGVIAAALAKQYPSENTDFAATYLQPELERLVGDTRQPLLILLGAVGLVLLIACANIANLLLARTASREHEMAVRAAIGASRGRVIRQLLTESLLLAILGGAAGTVLAENALRVVLPLGGRSIPRLAQAGIDQRVLGFSLILAFLTSVLFGMAPALQASKIDLTASLKEGTRGSASGHERLRGALVVAQITLGLVLVSGAGLLLASFVNLENGDLGMRTDHLLTFRFSLPETQYNETRQVNFYDRFLERMRSVPGVESAAGVWPLPLGGDNATVGFNIEERPAAPANWPSANMTFVTPGYFSTAAIPLLRGRFFTDRDDAKAPPVLIVNKAFADKFFPGEDVIGKRITPGATSDGEKETIHEIVGVVGNTKLSALSTETAPFYYFPYKQLAWMPPPLIVRTMVAPRSIESAVREQLAALDPQVPVYQVRTMDDLLALQVAEPRFHTLLLGCFAGIALLLTMVGLYGVMAYSVTRRTREIGVRIALGASRSAVLAMVLKQALLLVAAGLGLGLAGSVLGDRLLRSMLYGVSPTNPYVFALAGLLVALTGALAAYLPARRAASVDPMAALRHE